MQLKKVTIIEELEACKDILWFLKGYIKSNEQSDITTLHIAALSDVINELQTRIILENKTENKKDLNANI